MTTYRLLRSITPIAAISLTTIASVPAEFKPAEIQQFGASAQAASQRVRWTPRRRLGSVRSTLSGGRRGSADVKCQYGNGLAPTTLTLLVPKSNDELYTTAATPTFFWHIETEKAVSAKFVLSDPKTAEPIFTQTLQISRSSIASVELPESVPLQMGTKYRWTVLMACKEGGSGDVSARSFVERVDHASLLQRVSQASDFDQAVSFAQEGIWYDALSSLMRAQQDDPMNLALKAELDSLLAQVGNRPIGVAHQSIHMARQN